MFVPNPLQLKLMAAGAIAAAVAILALLVWGLYWRGEYREVNAKVVALEAQGNVLAEATRACTAGVDLAKQAGDQAVKDAREMLAEARRLAAGGRKQAAAIEDLLKKPPPPGAGCEDAWKEIEKTRAAQ